jgi:molybdopterin-guanine dinucleotide biosynthesis protein A
MIPTHDLTGMVLAGGEGRRMGGRDKGLEPFAGLPLVGHVVKRLEGQVTPTAFLLIVSLKTPKAALKAR